MSDADLDRSSGPENGLPARSGGPAASDEADRGGAALADALERARAVLAARGLSGDVDRAGHAGDMLVVAAPPGRIDDVRACAAELRKLGFRYVTIEIVPDA